MYTYSVWTSDLLPVDNLGLDAADRASNRGPRASDGRGLAFEVIPTGAASWRYGKTEKVSLEVPACEAEGCELKRDECAKAVRQGESPARQRQLEKFAMANATSVFDFSEQYFKEVIERDRKDTKQLRRYLEKEIYPAFGALSIKDVTAQDVQRLVFRKRDNGLLPGVAG
jgi:hypothetical protein